MNAVRSSIVAGVVAGATGALLFGGSAVSTAFTSDQSVHLSVGANAAPTRSVSPHGVQKAAPAPRITPTLVPTSSPKVATSTAAPAPTGSASTSDATCYSASLKIDAADGADGPPDAGISCTNNADSDANLTLTAIVNSGSGASCVDIDVDGTDGSTFQAPLATAAAGVTAGPIAAGETFAGTAHLSRDTSAACATATVSDLVVTYSLDPTAR